MRARTSAAGGGVHAWLGVYGAGTIGAEGVAEGVAA